MQKHKDDDQRTESQSRAELDNRYGKIGISAVAAAVRHPPATKQPAKRDDRRVPFDRD